MPAITLSGDMEEREHYLNCDYLFEDDEICSFEDIARVPLKSLPILFCFSVYTKNPSYPFFDHMLLTRKADFILIKATISYSLLEWQEEIGLITFTEQLCEKLAEFEFIELDGPTKEVSEIYISFSKHLNINSTLEQETKTIFEYILSLQKEILNNYRVLSGIAAKIKVSEEYGYAFAQYLMYFGQFLSDMGIGSETSVTNNNGLIILNINPSNKEDAIQNIYFALNSYLALADGESLIKPNLTPASELKYKQLMSNVEHLKLQLSYTQAMLEVKNEHINILQHEQEFSRTFIANQTSNQTKIVTEKWEPIEGISITKYKGNFFEIDIPKLIKKITRKF